MRLRHSADLIDAERARYSRIQRGLTGPRWTRASYNGPVPSAAACPSHPFSLGITIAITIYQHNQSYITEPPYTIWLKQLTISSSPCSCAFEPLFPMDWMYGDKDSAWWPRQPPRGSKQLKQQRLQLGFTNQASLNNVLISMRRGPKNKNVQCHV